MKLKNVKVGQFVKVKSTASTFTQQIDEEKKKIKTLTDLKNDVLIDVNNPVKSLEKHEG